MNSGRYFTESADKAVSCSLCPRNCQIKNGSFGSCSVRGNKNGMGIIPFYGFVSCLALDPIEKKPLYHYMPGSQILSVGFAGCNLHCPFCQNWRISQNTDIPGRQMKPQEIVSAAIGQNIQSIAYTYSEPLVHAEYLLDCMTLARERNIANVLVTNGCINSPAAKEILSLTDAANIDLKCFSAQTYAEVLGGGLETVLEFIRLAVSKDVHVEITTLLVSGLNDSDEELDMCADFICCLGKSSGKGHIPWHLSAYRPDYRWNAPPTDPAFLLKAAEKARSKLHFVYTGNIAAEKNNTACLHCGTVLVRRRGYSIELTGLAEPETKEKMYSCIKCGEKTSVMI
ncbi:MAG: AmmeMemoRadiSam system radical SAM enzyme [Treponema sp.]|nr:AmmeMemoRadiSam system radical SAM enzyme [Treponema sp.]